MTRQILPIVIAFSVVSELPAQAPRAVPDTAQFASLKWRMVGPYRGGRSTAITGIAGEPHVFFMGTTGGGVWKTDDAGTTWRNVSDGYFGGSIGAVEVAPSDPNVIYVGTGSACIRGNTSVGHGSYRSDDGGRTWKSIGLNDAGQIGDIVVHPTNADVVYFAALGHAFGRNRERGVFRSKDGGRTWQNVLFLNDSTGAVDLALNPKNPREIYAAMWRAERKPWTLISGATDAGVYKSTDGGDTWTRLAGGLPQGMVGKAGVTVSPANPDRVWVIIEAEPAGGVYRSDDAGKSWTRVNSENRLRQRAWYYTHIEADPRDENTVYVLNTGFYRSTDGGRTYENIDVPHGDMHDVWINPEHPNFIAVADDGGGQISLNNGRTFSTMNNQPTAELYDVAVDHAFPYRLYGAQQDNTTISVPAWMSGNTLHEKEGWRFVGGCETGPVALHPDHPNIVYAGCYGGVIDRFDLVSGDRRNMVLYPQLALGNAPRDLRERFQWTSPIVVSMHDPNTVFHASQRVHRTRDGGMSWETISGDLTTNTPEHQVAPGGPINVDATGVEMYNVVFSLAVSPHAADELWAGTDDGRVHITRDAGRSWSEATPPAMPRLGTVDEIELSRHAAGRAFLAVQRYRMDDFRPYVFRTNDGGRTWTLLTDGRNGIPATHPVRTVREDPQVRGLLYAGTEFGVYVSFDDGTSWHRLQLNLPVTPVTGMQVAHDDLIISTQGRSFWVLDDVSPLRELARGSSVRDRAHLFTPRPAVRADSRGPDDYDPRATARPGGALLHYWLPARVRSELTLNITDANGRTVPTFTSDSAKARAARRLGAGAVTDTMTLPDSAGMHRVTWNLMYPGPERLDSAVIWGYTGGILAPPGVYRVTLTADGQSQQRELRVLADPRLRVADADYAEQFRVAAEIRDSINQVYQAIRTTQGVRSQVTGVAARGAEAGFGDDLRPRADSLAGKLSGVLEELMQVRNRSGQDPIRFAPRIDNQYVALYEYVAGQDEYRAGGPDGRPTPGAIQRLRDLNAQWIVVRQRLQQILDGDVAAFNAELQRRGVPPIVLPRPRIVS